MYIHVDHRWFKTILKKVISVLLIYSIFFTTSVNASTVNGWSTSNPVAKGASTVYEGTKKVIIDGKDYIKKGTAIVTPTATGVAKTLAKGVAGVALSVAVEQLLGAVDWVLDPANNQIRYTKPDTSNDPCTAASCAPSEYLWKRDTDLGSFSSQNAICQAVASKYGHTLTGVGIQNGQFACFTKKPNGAADWWAVDRVANPTYDPSAEDENKEKTIPLEVVAAQVISNAEGNTDKKSGAQVATGAAAADIVQEAESDQTGTKARPIAQQFENSASTKPADEAAAAEANTATGTQTQNPTKPETTDLALEFPAFCGWAPIVCEAAQTVISFPQTLTEWWTTGKEKAEGWATSISESWTETKEWVKDDTKLDDADNDPPVIKDIPIGTLDTSAFKGTAGCPSSIQVPVAFAKSGNVEISYEPICAMASKWSFVAPFIGFFSGALIILGVGRKGEDSDT